MSELSTSPIDSTFLDLASYSRTPGSEPFLDDPQEQIIQNYSTSSLVSEMASTSISLPPPDDLGDSNNPPSLTLTVDEVYQVQVRDSVNGNHPPHFAEPAPATTPRAHNLFLNPLRSNDIDSKKSLIRQRSSNQSFDLSEPSAPQTLSTSNALHPRKIFRQRSHSNPDLTSSSSFMSFLNLGSQGSTEMTENYLGSILDQDQPNYFEQVSYTQDLEYPENFASYSSEFDGSSELHDSSSVFSPISDAHREPKVEGHEVQTIDGFQTLSDPPNAAEHQLQANHQQETYVQTAAVENGKKASKAGNAASKRTTTSKDPVIKARVSAMRKERSPEAESYKKLQATPSFLPAAQVTPDNHLFQFVDQEKPPISRKRSNSLPNVYGDAFPPPSPVMASMQPMIATNAYDANGVLQPVFLPMQNQPYFFPQASMPIYYPVQPQAQMFRKLVPKPQNSTAPLRSNRTWTFEMETGVNGKKSSKSS